MKPFVIIGLKKTVDLFIKVNYKKISRASMLLILENGYESYSSQWLEVDHWFR